MNQVSKCSHIYRKRETRPENLQNCTQRLFLALLSFGLCMVWGKIEVFATLCISLFHLCLYVHSMYIENCLYSKIFSIPLGLTSTKECVGGSFKVRVDLLSSKFSPGFYFLTERKNLHPSAISHSITF